MIYNYLYFVMSIGISKELLFATYGSSLRMAYNVIIIWLRSKSIALAGNTLP